MTPGEEWKDVPGFDGYYQASNTGSVKSKKKKRKKLQFHSAGYPMVILSKNNLSGRYYVHHLVALCFIGPRPVGKRINHKDGIKTNNHVSNLEYVTPREDIFHGYETGLHLAGERSFRAKLTDKQVSEILSRRRMGEKGKGLALEFGVSQSHISSMLHGRFLKYRHIVLQGKEIQ